MSWLFGPSETHGERAARAAQERDRANHDLRSQEWDRQVAYNSEQDWSRRNREHKKAVFDVEREQARREGRPPSYYSPEEVPDLVRPEPPAPELPWNWQGIAVRAGIFAWGKYKQRRAQAAAAQQAYEQAYAQNPYQDPYAGQAEQGYATGPAPSPYQAAPGYPMPFPTRPSPALPIAIIWATTLLGLPIVTGIVGFIAYLVSMGNQSTMLVINALMILAQVLGWVAAILATVHLLLVHNAYGNPVKLAAAAKWHPLYWPRQILGRRKL